jgi:hypothetical protein
MGYYVRMLSNEVRFKDGLDPDGEVLQAVKDKLFEPEYYAKHAGGGQHPKSGDLYKDRWYSWTSTEALREATSLEDFIGQFVEFVVIDDDGSLSMCFESKTGNERELFEALAPFIAPGSFIEWCGEGGEHYKWIFDGTAMRVAYGEVVYGEV